eukprot:g36769.t1
MNVRLSTIHKNRKADCYLSGDGLERERCNKIWVSPYTSPESKHAGAAGGDNGLHSKKIRVLEQNGSMILYNRKKVKYRKDGYCWKKRKDGKTTREDHMKLKVQDLFRKESEIADE